MKAVQLTRGQLRAVTMKLLKEQGGVCPLCTEPIDSSARQGVRTDYVADHDHETGLIRGILHRSCNGALGKMENAVGRWGAKSMSYKDIIPFIERALAYYRQEPHNLIYPGHKSEDERKEAARIKRNKAAALRRAMQKAKEIGR